MSSSSLLSAFGAAPQAPPAAALTFSRPAPTLDEQLAAPAAPPADIEIHPAAALFPMVTQGELQQLADDIRKNGQREPCVLHEEKLLDGRNRWAACRLAGVDPLVRPWVQGPDGESPIAFVLSMNLQRRHLKVTQRAALALDLVPLFEAEAKERMRRGVALSAVPRALPARQDQAAAGLAAARGRLLGILSARAASGVARDVVGLEVAEGPGADSTPRYTPAVLQERGPRAKRLRVHALPVGEELAVWTLCGEVEAPKRSRFVRKPEETIDCLGCLGALDALTPAQVASLFDTAADLGQTAALHRQPASECERVMVAVEVLCPGVPRPARGPLARLVTDIFQAYHDGYEAARARVQAEDSGRRPPKKRDESGRSLAQAAKTAGAGVGAVKKLAGATAREPAVKPLAAKDAASIEALVRVSKIPDPEARAAVVRELEAGAKPAAAAPPPKPKAEAPQTLGDLAELHLLIWCHRHSGWWRPRANGYTEDAREAGLYAPGSPEVQSALRNSELKVVRIDAIARPRAQGGRR